MYDKGYDLGRMTVIFHTITVTVVIPIPRVNTAPVPLHPHIHLLPTTPRHRDRKKLTLSHDLWSLIQSEIRGE
jgi:hypothetical protein